MFSHLERLDHQLFFALNNGLTAHWLDWLFWIVTVIGDGIPLTLIVGLYLWVYDRRTFRSHYGWMVFGVIAGSLLAQALKHGLDRPRPLAEFTSSLQQGEVYIHTVGKPLFQHSFPSGHVLSAAVVFTYLMCLYPRHGIWWGMGLLLVSLSRIYLGAHFPSDVLAGALLGILCTLGVVGLQRLRHAP